MEFDLFGLSAKDLSTRNVITKCNSSGALDALALTSRSFIACVCSFNPSCIAVYLASMSRPPGCRCPVKNYLMILVSFALGALMTIAILAS
jgi:hypothetical protein